MSIITLTTDFGLADNFVGVMKGIILGINPEAVLVDLTHEIPRHNIIYAGFTLWSACPYFPPGTIHVAVVDPGVGSARNILGVKAHGQLFVAPDNGLLTPMLDRDPRWEARLVQNPAIFLTRVSRTFHGRDIMAPTAAHLSVGFPFAEIGPEAVDLLRLTAMTPEQTADRITGRVIYVDHFGNLITNVSEDHLSGWPPSDINITAGHLRISGLSSSYASLPADRYLAIIGSTGLVEIARNMGRAEDPPHLTVNTPVVISKF